MLTKLVVVCPSSGVSGKRFFRQPGIIHTNIANKRGDRICKEVNPKNY